MIHQCDQCQDVGMIHQCDQCPGTEALSSYVMSLFTNADIDDEDIFNFKHLIKE